MFLIFKFVDVFNNAKDDVSSYQDLVDFDDYEEPKFEDMNMLFYFKRYSTVLGGEFLKPITWNFPDFEKLVLFEIRYI